MYDYLSGTQPDSFITLSVSPSYIEEFAYKNQSIIRCDDLTEEVISASDDPFFTVNLGWNVKSESDSGTIMDFWLSLSRGNGIKNSFLWTHNYDGYTYVVKFASAMTRSLLTSSIFRPANFTLRVLGYCSAEYYLYYDLDEQTGSFTAGNTIYGATSGESAVIESVDTTNGRLWITSISGSFTNGEIIYEDAYSSNILSNGGFDDDSYWSYDTGISIAGGVAVFNGVAYTDQIYQTVNYQKVGVFYKVEYTVSNYTIGSIIVTGGFVHADSNGTFTDLYEADQTTFAMYASNFGGVTTLDLDDVSLKQILNASTAIGTNTSPAAYYLSYDEPTGEFSPGNTIYGASSGASAKVERGDYDNMMVFLTNISGTFIDNEIIYEATYGDDLLDGEGNMEVATDFSTDIYTPDTNERSSDHAYAGTYSRKLVVSADIGGCMSRTFDGDPIEEDSFYYFTGYIWPVDNQSAHITCDFGTDWYSKTIGGLSLGQWNSFTWILQANVEHFTAIDGSGRVGFQSYPFSAGTWYGDNFRVYKITNAAFVNGALTAI